MDVLGTSLDRQHAAVCKALGLPKEFVIPSLRHTTLSRLGEAGADVFSIMKIAGHSNVTVRSAMCIQRPKDWNKCSNIHSKKAGS
jgi:hypothetical protein